MNSHNHVPRTERIAAMLVYDHPPTCFAQLHLSVKHVAGVNCQGTCSIRARELPNRQHVPRSHRDRLNELLSWLRYKITRLNAHLYTQGSLLFVINIISNGHFISWDVSNQLTKHNESEMIFIYIILPQSEPLTNRSRWYWDTAARQLGTDWQYGLFFSDSLSERSANANVTYLRGRQLSTGHKEQPNNRKEWPSTNKLTLLAFFHPLFGEF